MIHITQNCIECNKKNAYMTGGIHGDSRQAKIQFFSIVGIIF